MTTREAEKRLHMYRLCLTRQQTRTIMGQIKKGNVEAAMRGLDRILDKGKKVKANKV